MADSLHDLDDEFHRQFFLIHDAFNRLSDAWLGSLATAIPLLYHYTDSAALLGILQSQQLFATDVRYVNDPRELQHGREIVGGALKTWETAPAEKGIIESLSSFDPMTVTEVYATSLSSKADDPGQWFRYAQSPSGVCLGFKFGTPAFGIRLLPIIYDHQEQRRLTFKAIKEGLILADRLRQHCTHPQIDILGTLSSSFAEALGELSLTFKDGNWIDEAEWRLTTTSPSMFEELISPPKFRARPTGIVPYQALEATRLELSGDAPASPDSTPKQPKLPLVSVTVSAAHPEPNLAINAIRKLVRSYGYNHVDIQLSKFARRL